MPSAKGLAKLALGTALVSKFACLLFGAVLALILVCRLP
jgi:ABC-type sulfate transport system permease component